MHIHYTLLLLLIVYYSNGSKNWSSGSLYRWGSGIENNRYYPRYHLAPPKGWMNDPNGFCFFKGEYHLFYQYNPESSLEPGIAHWGHAKSKDLFHWVDLGVALKPNNDYDAQGVFSGSAEVDKGIMYLFYTGNVNHEGQYPNHTQVQALATSSDGQNFKKYADNPIIEGKNLQPDFRDPKVWKHGKDWYMVLGNSFNKTLDSGNITLGRALLFKSPDAYNWKQVSVLDESDGFLGYMWECPDFFEIDGRFVLLFSPQGVEPQGDRFKNLYQTGYIVGHFDYEYNVFTPETEFKELDFGHDFYATQTILDENGRRLLVAWMDMWETEYPERDDGFTGQMTMVRKLSLTPDNRLIQKPVREIAKLKSKALFVGNSWGKTTVSLPNKTGEVYIIAPRTKDLTLYIESDNVAVIIKYEFLSGRVSLDRGGNDGLRRTKYRPLGKLKLRAFIDASSIELFWGEGDVTFSSRFFPPGPIKVRLGDDSVAEFLSVQSIKSTLYL